MKQIYAVDFDDVLRTNKNRVIVEGREIINRLIDCPKNFIVIYTSRNCSGKQYEFVRDFCKKNKIKYHAIVLGKIRADSYIDDKAIKFVNSKVVKKI